MRYDETCLHGVIYFYQTTYKQSHSIRLIVTQRKIIIITAPSGSGKTTLVKRLLAASPESLTEFYPHAFIDLAAPSIPSALDSDTSFVNQRLAGVHPVDLGLV